MFAFGVGLERAVIRPILGQPQFTVVMLTIGVGYTARGLVSMIPEIGTRPTPWPCLMPARCSTWLAR